MAGILRGVVRCFAALGLSGLLYGCGMSTPQERELQVRQMAEEQEAAQLRARVSASVQIEDVVLALVQSNAAPEGPGTTADWLIRLGNEGRGQILQPNWRVMRRSPNLFDVRYDYSIIRDDGDTERIGYLWSVDSTLRSVGKPRRIALASPDRRAAQQTLTRDERLRLEEAEIE